MIRGSVEAARAIRFVAIFVVGLVIAMGGAMIYAVAVQTRQERAAVDRPRLASPSGAVSDPPEVAKEVSAPATGMGSVVPVPAATPTETELVVSPPRTSVVPASALAANLTRNRPPEVEPQPSKADSQTSGRTSTLAASTINTSSTAFVAAPLMHGSNIAAGKEAKPTAVSAPEPQPRTVTLWSGTPLIVKLNSAISTSHTAKGEYFWATLEKPIVRDGFIIADAGSPVKGEIIAAKHGGVFHGAADLRLILVELHTTDKQAVPIESASLDDHGRARNPVTGTIRSAFGATVGVLTGTHGDGSFVPQQETEARTGKKGRDIMLPANTLLQFQLAAPVSLTEHTR